jgi:hypothetical protein
MTDKQAFAAMFNFLKDLYSHTQSDDLGALLGAMSILEDGSTADPAVWSDWEKAVRSALQGHGPDLLAFRKSDEGEHD